MRGSRLDYRDRLGDAGGGGRRGTRPSFLGPRSFFEKSRAPPREHSLDLPPPHQRNGGNWSHSIPTKTTQAGPPPPFFGGLAVGQHLYLFDRQILSAAFSFGLVVGIQVDTVCSGLPRGSGSTQRNKARGPRTEVRAARAEHRDALAHIPCPCNADWVLGTFALRPSDH